MVLRKRMITSILTNEKSVPEAVVGGETVHTYTNNQTEYVIYLDKEITGPHEYREVYETLRRATSQDIVRFIINCEGGEIDTAFQICHYMERNQLKQ